MTDKLVELPDGRVVAFPDTMSDAEITAAIEGSSAPAPAQDKPRPTQHDGPTPLWFGDYKRARESGLDPLDDLPTAGALVGSFATGGALLPALAATMGGGMAGKATQHVARGESPLNADVLTEGAKQGAYELGGRGVAAAARGIGKGLYNVALGPSKALTRDFGDIAEAGIEAGAIPGTKRAVASVDAARKASSAEARGMLADKLPPGARIKVDVPLKGLDDLRARVKSNPTAKRDLAAVDAFADDVRASHPEGFTADELLNFKQAGQAKASQHYRAAQTGDIAGQMDADANAAVAGGAQKFLEDLAPGTKGANVRTKELIGLERALEDAAARPNVMRYLLSVPTAGTSLLTVPQIGGAAGMVANKAGKALGRGRAPNVARVLELLLSGEAER